MNTRASLASRSSSTPSTTSSTACAPTAPNSSARWRSTGTSTGTANPRPRRHHHRAGRGAPLNDTPRIGITEGHWFSRKTDRAPRGDHGQRASPARLMRSAGRPVGPSELGATRRVTIAVVSSLERKRRQPGLATDDPAFVGRHQLVRGIQGSYVHFDFVCAACEHGGAATGTEKAPGVVACFAIDRHRILREHRGSVKKGPMMLAAVETVTNADPVWESRRHNSDVAAQATAGESVHAASAPGRPAPSPADSPRRYVSAPGRWANPRHCPDARFRASFLTLFSCRRRSACVHGSVRHRGLGFPLEAMS